MNMIVTEEGERSHAKDFVLSKFAGFFNKI
jgi:hypothetical protein